MAINHGKLMQTLERITAAPDPESFIYDFLAAYEIPKSTLTRLRQGGDRNIGREPGDVGLRLKLYFRSVPRGTDPFEAAAALKDDELIARHKVRFVVVTDFEDLVAYDLGFDDSIDCALSDLNRHYSFFLPLAGYEKARTHTESAADIKAAEKMGRLCDIIRKENDFSSREDLHALNVFLTRVLFCLFAEDTGIFAKHQFTNALKANTRKDGNDVDTFLEQLFEVLNAKNRPSDCPAHLDAFPYVNGGLFRESLPVPAMGKRARRYLLDAGTLDWSEINPDIFGSMFQAVIEPEQRGSLGQHYTSVSNIMKVIRPLFLDKLEEELERSRKSRRRLQALLTRLQRIKVFDPACGSGNFLIIAYKELRRIEMAVFEAMEALSAQKMEPLVPDDQSEMFDRPGQQKLSAPSGQREIFMSGISLSQFYGIEIDDFAHEIAQLSLWLAEHQMNRAFRARFGYAEPSLPLRSGGRIALGNALRLDWNEVCPKEPQEEVYVCGNPPFVGSKKRSEQQNHDMQEVFSSFKKHRMLDFVASWVWRGADYIRSTEAECAFVTTNSLCQGEQVSTLWPNILGLGVEIAFAYQSFTWRNSARDNAGVHVSIVGLRDTNTRHRGGKRIYSKMDGQWRARQVDNISPYLVEGGNITVYGRRTPLRQCQPMIYGNYYSKSGPLTLRSEEAEELIEREPGAEKWLKRLLGSDEFFYGKERWCLWLVDADKRDIDGMPMVRARVEETRRERQKSADKAMKDLIERPHLFRDTRNPDRYLVVPIVSSERRTYVPIGYFDGSVIATNKVFMIPDADLYTLGILSSLCHLDWMRLTSGRLKSDYSYSIKLTYNTFPWPTVTGAQRREIEHLADEILLIREDYFDWTMAEMYDPDKMPEPLREAHAALDRAVEKLYRDKPFRDQAERQEYLLARYQQLIREEEAEERALKAAQGA